MSGYRSGRPFYLVYCLLAVILFGCYVMLQWLSGRQLRNHGPEFDTQSLTSRALFFGNAPARPRRQEDMPLFAPARG